MNLITVFGATGSTGLPLLRLLLEAGVPVRAAVRDEPRARDLFRRAGVALDRLEIVRADLADPVAAARALEGAERCYVAVGGPSGTPDLVRVEKAFIEQARRAELRHYVRVAGIGARPDGLSVIERMHGEISEHLIRSGVPYTMLEPSFFMQNLLALAPAIAQGVLPLPAGAGRAAFIDARDVALVAAKVLASDAHLGARLVLTGPELLDHHEVARVLSLGLGRSVGYADVPPRAFTASLVAAGAHPWFAELLADVYAMLCATGRAERLTQEVPRLTGRPARTLRTFVEDHRGWFEAAMAAQPRAS